MLAAPPTPSVMNLAVENIANGSPGNGGYLVLMLTAGALGLGLSASYLHTDSVRRQQRAWAGHRGRCYQQATRTADGILKKAVDVAPRELVRRRQRPAASRTWMLPSRWVPFQRSCGASANSPSKARTPAMFVPHLLNPLTMYVAHSIPKNMMIIILNFSFVDLPMWQLGFRFSKFESRK